MKFSTVLALLASGALTLAAPAPASNVPSNYASLPPSERAAIDATNLVCGQYPDRTWIMIGAVKYDCPTAATKGKRSAEAEADVEGKRGTDGTLDANWYVEYRTI